MLPKKRRLSTELFTTVVKNGITYHFPSFSLRAHKVDSQEKSRFSVVVSKKVAKKAVDRNTLKRKMYSRIAEYLPSLPTSYSSVFFLKKEFSIKKPEEIRQDIEDSIKKVYHISLS